MIETMRKHRISDLDLNSKSSVPHDVNQEDE